ncbi:CNNM domain-containing protein [Halorussus lipolyticus]|uniref:CNNM domain-containing protein n=1 Tax=Halorussus lipolyticus TaxID=3034024 RepID=UPI0023E88B6D|nr:CNNM domain-containing protein [Halorussus sp. DT80]
MVALDTVLRVAGGGLLLLGNGYFVTIEFAMTRVRQFTEGEFQGSMGLERAWEMTDKLEIFLSGCQLGITICSVGLGVVAEPALATLLTPVIALTGISSHAASAIAALTIINLLHVIVGEQAPTYLGIERTRFVAKYGSAPLYYWTKIFSPVIILSDKAAKWLLSLFGVEITRSWTEAEEGEDTQISTRGDVRREIGDLLSRTDLEDEREEEVLAAFAIDDILASDIMVDREDVVSLSVDDDPDAVVRTVEEHPFSRFPLVDGELAEFVGVIHAPVLVTNLDGLRAGETTLAEIAIDPMTVPADQAVSEVIDQFQAQHHELALVESEGEVVGLVTATDAFEAVMGDLEDPFDEEERPEATS